VQQSIKNTHLSHIISHKTFTPIISKYIQKSIESYSQILNQLDHSQTFTITLVTMKLRAKDTIQCPSLTNNSNTWKERE